MTLTIVAIRHGKPLSEGYAEDALRPLAEEGKQAIHQKLFALQELGFVPDLLLSSPLLRAEQSAEVAAELYDFKVEVTPALGIPFDSDGLLARLSEERGTVFLFGHAPSLGEFIERLVGEVVLPHGLPNEGAAIAKCDDEVAFGAALFSGAV